jgi:hypothetical protein
LSEECWKKVLSSIRIQCEVLNGLPKVIKGPLPGFCTKEGCGCFTASSNCYQNADGCPKLTPKGKLGTCAPMTIFCGRTVYKIEPAGTGHAKSKHPAPTYWPTRVDIETTRFGGPHTATVSPKGWASEVGPSPALHRDAYEKAGKRRLSKKEFAEAKQAYLDEVFGAAPKEQFARQLYLLEMRDARRKAFYASEPAVETTDCGTMGYRSAMVPGVKPFNGGGWLLEGMKVSSFPDALLIPREDRELMARILAKSPGRPVGRPPKNGMWRMTGAEKVRDHRARKKEQKEEEQKEAAE